MIIFPLNNRTHQAALLITYYLSLPIVIHSRTLAAFFFFSLSIPLSILSLRPSLFLSLSPSLPFLFFSLPSFLLLSLSPSLPISVSLFLFPLFFYLSLHPPPLSLLFPPSCFLFFWGVVPGFENRPCSLNGMEML